MRTLTTKSGNEIKIFAATIEGEALDQIKALCAVDAYQDARIRIMPDCHAGAGCTIGTTMTIKDKVTPNLVGVDIGCGMLIIKLKENDVDLETLDYVIKKHIPCGFAVRSRAVVDFDFSRLRCKDAVDLKRGAKAIGTLGGGNHFIEAGKNSKGEMFLIIHSGSRHIGLEVANHYQRVAWNKLSSSSKGKKQTGSTAVPKSLAYLTGSDFEDYMNDMSVMQQYAVLNRRTMADIILKETGLKEESSFETIHNYIDFNRMILRKGAVSAEKDELLLIPLNMRDGSLICRGKGNPDWNYSAPHGAGRLMSRRKAKERLSLPEFKKQMKGIYSTSVVKSTLDEAPDAYKPVGEIMSMIKETVDVVDKIKPVYNFKAH